MSVESQPFTEMNVAITGAGGQIGSLVAREVLSGNVFGDNVRVNASLLEAPIPEAMKRLEGVVMELEDMAFPNGGQIDVYDDPNDAFEGANVAVFVGAMPRKEGMERADLLEANGRIFQEQGRALGEHAADDVRAVVVGNPANSNALVLANAAPDIPERRITAMSRLDHNRAVGLLAKTLGVSPGAIKGMVVWGNHSKTMVPDLTHVTVNGEPLSDEFKANLEWYEEFREQVANRGDAVLETKGTSSVMSAATAAADHVRDWFQGTDGEMVSMAVKSWGEHGVPEGVFSSFPVTTTPGGELTIVQGFGKPEHVFNRIKESGRELEREKDTLHRLGLLAMN